MVFRKTSHGGTKDTETTEEFKLYIPPCLRELRERSSKHTRRNLMNKIRVLVQAIVMIGILTGCDGCNDEVLNGPFTLSNGKTVTLEGVASAGERNAILNALNGMSGPNITTVLNRNITIKVETLSDNFKVYSSTLLGINRAFISNALFALSLESNLAGAMFSA
jgi:hypothetical protein